MVTGLETGGRTVRQHGSGGEAATEPLGQGDNVRRYPQACRGEKRSRAAHAALNFVRNQEQSTPIAEGANPLKVGAVRGMNAAFPLNRLQHDRYRLLADRRFQGREVIEWHMLEAFGHGGKGPLVLLLSRGRQGGERAAMKAVQSGNDLKGPASM